MQVLTDVGKEKSGGLGLSVCEHKATTNEFFVKRVVLTRGGDLESMIMVKTERAKRVTMQECE